MTSSHRYPRLLPAVATVLALVACSVGDDADGDVAAPHSAGADGEPLTTDPPRPQTTDVVLTLASWDAGAGTVVASGYVSPVVEDGGSCLLELTRDGETRTATTEGLADASTTVCGDLQMPGDDLTAGTWTAVLRYESANASGESAPLDVEVPA